MDKLLSGLNGIFGFLLLVVVLLAVVFGLGMQAWKTQRAQVQNSYTLDYQEIRANDAQNIKYYKMNDKEAK